MKTIRPGALGRLAGARRPLPAFSARPLLARPPPGPAPGPPRPRAAVGEAPASSSAASASASAAAAAAMPKEAAGRVPSLKGQVQEVFQEGLREAFPEAGAIEPLVAVCGDPKFGDFQCNNAMSLFGRLKGREGAPANPRAVGEAIIAALPETSLVENLSVAGPGFVNAFVNRAALGRHVKTLLVDGVQAWAPPPPCERAVVDFSSPNVAKEMHVGHLRGTIIGDTLCRVLEYTGAEVLRLNHIGDWGTQFGMLIQHMAELDSDPDAPVADLMELYKEAKDRFDADAGFKARAQEAVVGLQAGDPASTARWEKICEASRREFQSLYDRLDVELVERGESFYNPMLEPLVEEMLARGVAEESEGATCVFVEGEEVPLMIRKSDGGFGYGTTDLAAIRHRIQHENCDWLFYLTDLGQQGHFKKVFKAAEKAGFVAGAGKPMRIEHVGFGLVLGDDGKRFRTRSGDVVKLVDLLDEAVDRCAAQISERRGDLSDAEVRAAAEALGYGAVKYADLKQNRQSDYVFNFDKMLDLKGDTAVYLMYAYARICSILAKSGRDLDALVASASLDLAHPKEEQLALRLADFPAAVEAVIEDMAPNKLCNYTSELAAAFTDFYGECKVIGSPEEASRLLLCKCTVTVMKQCFDLMGVRALNKL